MKKTICAALLFIMLFSFASCGTTLDMHTFTSAMQQVDDDLTFENVGDTYTAQYDGIAKAYYAVVCEDSISSIKIICEDMPLDNMSTANEILSVCEKEAGKMTRNDLKVVSCYLRLSYLIEVLDKEPDDVYTVASMIANDAKEDMGGWTVKVERTTDSIIIRAEK